VGDRIFIEFPAASRRGGIRKGACCPLAAPARFTIAASDIDPRYLKRRRFPYRCATSCVNRQLNFRLVKRNEFRARRSLDIERSEAGEREREREMLLKGKSRFTAANAALH